MNTKIHKQVNALSIDLLKAAKRKDEQSFYSLYDELKALCFDNESDEVKNHPEQWETLADFTDEMEDAITYYKVALKYAQQINSSEFIASINYAMGVMYKDAGYAQDAHTCALLAQEKMARVHDNVLKEEIEQLLTDINHF